MRETAVSTPSSCLMARPSASARCRMLLSETAVASRWVQSETNAAIALEHQGALRLLYETRSKAALITLGDQGLIVFDRGAPAPDLPRRATPGTQGSWIIARVPSFSADFRGARDRRPGRRT